LESTIRSFLSLLFSRLNNLSSSAAPHKTRSLDSTPASLPFFEHENTTNKLPSGHCANPFSQALDGQEGKKGLQDCIPLIQGLINTCYKGHLELIHFKKCALFQSVLPNAIQITVMLSDE